MADGPDPGLSPTDRGALHNATRLQLLAVAPGTAGYVGLYLAVLARVRWGSPNVAAVLGLLCLCCFLPWWVLDARTTKKHEPLEKAVETPRTIRRAFVGVGLSIVVAGSWVSGFPTDPTGSFVDGFILLGTIVYFPAVPVLWYEGWRIRRAAEDEP